MRRPGFGQPQRQAFSGEALLAVRHLGPEEGVGVLVAPLQSRIQTLLETEGLTGSGEGAARKGLVPLPEPQGAPLSVPVGLWRNCWAIVQKNARKSLASRLQRGWGLFLPVRKLHVGFRRVAWGLGCQGSTAAGGRAEHSPCVSLCVSCLRPGAGSRWQSLGPRAAPGRIACMLGHWGLTDAVSPQLGLKGWGMGSISGRGTVGAKVGRYGKPRQQGQSGGLRRPWEGPVLSALCWSRKPQGCGGAGQGLGRSRNPGLTRTGLPGFSACEGDSVSTRRATVVGVQRRGLGWAWTPGRASWRNRPSCVWLTWGPRRSGDGGGSR